MPFKYKQKHNKKRILLLLVVVWSSTRSGGGCWAFQNLAVSISRATFASNQLHSRLRSSSAAAGPGDTTNTGIANQDDTIHSEILQGRSTKAVKLRKALQEIWRRDDDSSDKSNVPIIIVGPSGSGKRSLAEELVDKLPSAQTQKVSRLELDEAVHHVDTMLGTSGSNGHPGILDELASQSNTTLILRGFQSVTADSSEHFSRRQEMFQTLAKLVSEQTFDSCFEGASKPFLPRIIVLCSCGREHPEFGKNVLNVKVPALESRTADMEAIAAAKIRHLEGIYGLRNVKLSREATHRLLDHKWEVGETELDQELGNALELLSLEQDQQKKKRNLQPFFFATSSSPLVLESKHMLVNSYNEKMRHRLLYEYPVLRKIIQSPWVFDHTLRYIVTPAFIAVLAILFLGPQTRDHNTALTIFWAGWWPAVMLAYPFLGRIWCSICPFMAIGNFAQEASIRMGVELKKWPSWGQTAGSAFAFSLFFAILMWEELWDLPQNGALSAWLLLLITSGAVFNSVQFENRFWCRYLCPIGAMCRVFGTLSMLEVRSWKANCEGCTDPKCIKGGAPNPPAVDASDIFALKGCTMKLKNNQLRDMGDCTMCMSCVNNCDREVPELNSRPIGLDYGLPWLLPKALQKPENLSLSQVETNFWMGALVTVLQGSVLVHYMPTILSDLGVDPIIAKAAPALDGPFAAHLGVTAGLLALPGLLSLAADMVSDPLESALTSWQSQQERKTSSDEQQVIIDVYERILNSDTNMAETLRKFDPDGDGQISCWECKQGFQKLNLQDSQCEVLMGAMKRRFPHLDAETTRVPLTEWVDYFGELYRNARQAQEGSEKSPIFGGKFRTKKTFVEIFNDLDQDGDGFINEKDFGVIFEKRYLEKTLTTKEQSDLFASADVLGNGRLNLFEFMRVMRKTVQVGIQEIGYGYFPLAWASLTAYWLSIGMTEIGLSLARLPDTFFMEEWFSSIHLPQIVASPDVVHATQALIMVGSVPFTLALTQKLCDDNKIGTVRFGLHAGIQVAGAALTLYLMLSPNPLVA